MTRLAAVLAAALRDADAGSWSGTRQQYAEYPLTAERVLAAIPEPVRDAIEAALDRCAFASGDGTLHCGYPKDAQCHRQPDPTTGARMGRHMFVPLVAP